MLKTHIYTAQTHGGTLNTRLCVEIQYYMWYGTVHGVGIYSMF